MNQQKAVEVFLQSVAECQRRDPTAPALPAELEIACQGVARNRTLEAANA